jgi:hypothetical protein
LCLGRWAFNDACACQLMFGGRWTYGYVVVLEDLCRAGGVFTWHVVYFQVDVLFFKRGKEGEVGDLGPSAAKSECSH